MGTNYLQRFVFGDPSWDNLTDEEKEQRRTREQKRREEEERLFPWPYFGGEYGRGPKYAHIVSVDSDEHGEPIAIFHTHDGIKVVTYYEGRHQCEVYTMSDEQREAFARALYPEGFEKQ